MLLPVSEKNRESPPFSKSKADDRAQKRSHASLEVPQSCRTFCCNPVQRTKESSSYIYMHWSRQHPLVAYTAQETVLNLHQSFGCHNFLQAICAVVLWDLCLCEGFFLLLWCCSTTVWQQRPPGATAPDLELFFEGFGVRGETIAKLKELGFTSKAFTSNLDELPSIIVSIKQHSCHLTVGEEQGIKCAAKHWQKGIHLLPQTELFLCVLISLSFLLL
jgi:hypothetical protein